jgi:hypothetical protein
MSGKVGTLAVLTQAIYQMQENRLKNCFFTKAACKLRRHL